MRSPDLEGAFSVKVFNTFGATSSLCLKPALPRLAHQHRHHRIVAHLVVRNR